MGILSWWSGSSKPTPTEPNPTKTDNITGDLFTQNGGAMEIPRRPADVTVFEFGSAKASNDKVTIAGYCPVSEELEPCRWEILPASGSNPPQFRVVF